MIAKGKEANRIKRKSVTTGSSLSRVDPELAHILQNLTERIEASTPSPEPPLGAPLPISPEPNLPSYGDAPYCPMPSDLCRVSPFFPLNRKDMKDRIFLTDMVIAKSSWGSITYTGPKLTTYEEDVLMAILAILNLKNSRIEADIDGRRTYMYRGSMLALLRLMAYKEYGKSIYKRVLHGLSLLTVAGMRLTVKKQDQSREWVMSSILAAVKYDEKMKQLTVVVNPYFYEIFASGSYTLFNLKQRMAIDSPVAKCLHRFVMSHRSNEWRGHFMTLATSLNLDADQPKYQIRRLLSKAILTLTEMDILCSRSRLMTKDIVVLVRKETVKAHRKAKPPAT